MDPEFLLVYAYAVAQESKDPSTQNAALIVSGDKILVSAPNEFPAGIKDAPARWERPAKYTYVEHAERNVIYNAARHGYPTGGTTMVCPWAACPDCARAIIQAGISHLVVHQQALDRTPDRWRSEIGIADDLLDEAGVRISRISAFLNFAGSIRHCGKPFHP